MSRGRVAVLALGVLLLCGAPYEFCAAREAAKRVQLAATYRVEFGAFNLGDFHLTATLAEPKYELKAKGKFSFISGMIYRASGRTETTGKLSKNGAEPSQFEVIYKGGSKKEERRFNFVNGAVDQNFRRAAEKAKSAQCSNNGGSAQECARSSDGGVPVCTRQRILQSSRNLQANRSRLRRQAALRHRSRRRSDPSPCLRARRLAFPVRWPFAG